MKTVSWMQRNVAKTLVNKIACRILKFESEINQFFSFSLDIKRKKLLDNDIEGIENNSVRCLSIF